MGGGDIKAKSRKARGLKGGCGCLALVFLIVVATAFVASLLLARWEPENKAWIRLPADTVWAVQAHDLKTLLQAVARDPGAASLVLAGREALMERLTPDEEIPPTDFLDVYRDFGWLHTLAAPNSFVVGGSDFTAEQSFMLFQTPTWLRWIMRVPGWGVDGIQRHDDDEGIILYFAAHEGWIIAALSSDRVQSVLDGWEDGARPLGTGPEGEDSHLFFAMRDIPEHTANTQVQMPPTHFTFADPFAATIEAGRGNDDMDGLAIRIMLKPFDKGWHFWGCVDALGDVDIENSLASQVDSVLGDAFPEKSVSGPYDVCVAAKLSSEARGKLLTLFPRGGTPDERADHRSILTALAQNWLRDSWLTNTGETWSFLAKAPIHADPLLPYPPLPWFGLGWSIAPGTNPADAADMFEVGLKRLIDAFGRPGGHPLLSSARASISYSPGESSSDSPGGVLAVPSVLVNGSRPAWRFSLQKTPPTGWIVSDPDGMPKHETVLDSSWPNRLLPAPDHAVVLGDWNFRKEFLNAVVDVVEDRVRIRLAGRAAVSGSPEFRLERGMRIFRLAAVAFPQGSVQTDWDTKNRRCIFKAAIPRAGDAK